MSGIFVDKNSDIKVRIFIAKDKQGRRIFADPDLVALKRDNTDIDVNTVEEHEITFRQPTYKEEVGVMSRGLQANADMLQFNFAEVNYARITNLIVDWDFVDEQGEEIPPTKENIDQLHPAVASAMTSALGEYL